MKTIRSKPSLLSGQVDIPGDKSISHRALMLASIASGESRIDNLLEGHDCFATVAVMRALGVHIALEKGSWVVQGQGKGGLVEPASVLDCKNSGTTIRLMAGLLSGLPFMSILDGTDQIKSRPMDRVIAPLRKMGAQIFGRMENRLAPMAIVPGALNGIDYQLPVKSAQVKSALILAGLNAKGKTRISNTAVTRDHTERMLSHMGVTIVDGDDFVEINPNSGELAPLNFRVPGDLSSAAFLIVAAVILAKNPVTLTQVGVNHTRTGIIDALKLMGGDIQIVNETMVANEPVADIVIKKSELVGQIFQGDHIVRMIDEIPILALAATQSKGETVIRDAAELKVKESNRIKKTVELLSMLGADIEERDDGMVIRGSTKLSGGHLSSFGDHRLALMLAVAGLMAKDSVTVDHAEVVNDSFPGFIERILALGGDCEAIG